MLTAQQRAEILLLTAESGLDSESASDDLIWLDFLAALFAAGKTLADLALSRSAQPEILACLRRTVSRGPRSFRRGGEGLVE